MLGLTPFETLMASVLAFQVIARIGEWVFRRNADAGEFVKRHEWEAARLKDAEDARHFTRNQLSTYTTRELYDRDWKETNRRLTHLEGMGIGT